MVRYLDPKYDLTFKRVFGEHKELCISLINSMLPLEETQEVVSIEYQTGELVPELPALRHSIVDVRCTDNYGRQFIVKMQMNWIDEYKDRVRLKDSKAYVRLLDKSQKVELQNPIFALNFMNENIDNSPEMLDKYYHHYKIVNAKNTETQIKGFEFIFIELNKFKPQNDATRKLHDLWLRFLTEVNEWMEIVLEELLSNEYINEAMKYMEIAAYNDDQRYIYDRIKIDVLTAKSMYSSAREEGFAEGFAIGLAEAKAISLAEAKVIINIATNLLKQGISIDDIAKSTGLTAEKIRNLQYKKT